MENDMVNHPNHYKSNSGMETIDVIEAFTEDLKGYEATNTGNVIKYICRWKKKNGLLDLKKAQWYLNRLIEKVEKAEKPDDESLPKIITEFYESIYANDYERDIFSAFERSKHLDLAFRFGYDDVKIEINTNKKHYFRRGIEFTPLTKNETIESLEQMGLLIADMCLCGASVEEFEHAIKHCRVILHSEKMLLNWRESEQDYKISELREKYYEKKEIGDET